MKKIEFIDLVRANIDSIDKTRKIHPKIVEHEISVAYNEMIVKTYTKDRYDLGLFTKKYGTTTGTKISVTLDSYTNQWYSLLPQEIIPLPDLNAGVVSVLTKASSALYFAPMRLDEIRLTQGLELEDIDDVIGFSVYGSSVGDTTRYGRVVYTGMTTSIANVGVVMELIIPFHAYDDDDIVYFPKGQDETILTSVMQRLGVIPSPDLLNNNSDIKQRKQ